MSKDLFIEEYERRLYEMEDRLGRPLTREEEDRLGDEAYDGMRDTMADRADALRQREKDEDGKRQLLRWIQMEKA